MRISCKSIFLVVILGDIIEALKIEFAIRYIILQSGEILFSLDA